MIVVRRVVALLLIPVFILLFLSTMLVFRVNATFLEPEFYVSTIKDVDVFNFMYDEGIPYAIDEAKANGDVNLDALTIGVDVSSDAISDRIATVLPPEWLEENTASVIEQVVPYITGDTDTFEVRLTLDERVEAAAAVFKDVVQEADVHGYVVDQVIRGEIDDRGGLNNLPFGMQLTTDQVIDGVVNVVPEQWLKDQVTRAVDEMTPYLLGREGSFSVTIPLQDRGEAALEVIEEWLLLSVEEGGAYDYLLEEQIAPVVQSSLGSLVELPYGVTLTNEEVVEAIGQVLTKDWVKTQAIAMIDAVGPYLIGTEDSFEVPILLAEPKQVAVGVLVDTADLKFRQVYESLRVCTLPELANLSLSLDELPPCRPPLVTYDQLKGLVGLDVVEIVVQSIVDPLPDQIVLDDTMIFAALGNTGGVGDDSAFDTIETIRDTMKNGYTFTNEDMIALIRDQADSPEQADGYVQLIEDVRGYLSDGFVFTEQDLLLRAGANADFETFHAVRGYVHQGRTYLFWLVLLPILLAAVIGLLGGRNRGSKLAWTGVPIFVAAILAALAFGPATDYGFSATDPIITANAEIPEVIKAKIFDVRDGLRASFVSPMAIQATVLAVVGLAIIVGGIVLSRRRGKQFDWTIEEGPERARVALPVGAGDD